MQHTVERHIVSALEDGVADAPNTTREVGSSDGEGCTKIWDIIGAIKDQKGEIWGGAAENIIRCKRLELQRIVITVKVLLQ